MNKVLAREIEWCKKNRGASGKGKEFEKGFIAGLKQAQFLWKQQRHLQRERETKVVVARRGRAGEVRR